MRIGILGSGLMGGKLGSLFARAGHAVVFSCAHSEQKLKRLAREAQGTARAGTPGEAAREADALLLAVHWSPTPPRARRRWRRWLQGHGSCPPSTLFPARCCSACSRPKATPSDRASCTAGMTGAERT